MGLKFKTTILCMCAALLVALLVMPQPAEAEGWNVTRNAEANTLIFGGNNQQVSAVTFLYDSTDDAVIQEQSGDTTTVTVTYGDLMITNMTRDSDTDLTAPSTDNFDIWCSADIDAATPTITKCDGDSQPRATIANDKDGKGSVTIVTPNGYNEDFRLAYIRLDVSGLADKADVPIAITRGKNTQVPLSGTAASAVSGVVGTIAMGLKVTADPKAGLTCSADVFPTITVAEGFKGAWKQDSATDDPGQPATNAVHVKIAVGGFPSGGKIEWPSPVAAKADTDDNADTADVTIGTLTLVAGDSKANGQEVVYKYAPDPAVTGDNARPGHDSENKIARSFAVTPSKITIDGDQTMSVTAMLFPTATLDAKGNKSNLSSVLSFDAAAVAPEKDKGDEWLVLSECVTYLLYPFITCGQTPGWSTGISVSNTSADGNVFGAFDEAKEQAGSVVMYGFPRGQAAPAEGMEVEPVVSTLSTSLMAGDTITLDCSTTTMAGMEGYAIIKAGFQHARGMGFVLGNFSDGASVDVSHGYMAEVITDPADRSETIP